MKKIFILIIISTLIFGTLTSSGKVDTQKNLENSEKTSTQDTTSAKNTTLFDEEECHPLPILMFFNEIGEILKLDEAVNLHDVAFAKYLEENNYENYFLQDKNDFMDLLKNLNGIYLLIMNEKPDYIDYAFEYESLTIIYETPVKITFKIKCSKNSAKEDFDKIKSDENAILTYVHEADGFRIYNLKYKDKTYEDKEIFVADLGGYYASFLIFEKK